MKNGVHFENVGKFLYMGYAECSKFGVCGKSDFDDEVIIKTERESVIKTEREGVHVCDVCED